MAPKKCSMCSTVYTDPEKHFYKCAAYKDGYFSRCKECVKATNKARTAELHDLRAAFENSDTAALQKEIAELEARVVQIKAAHAEEMVELKVRLERAEKKWSDMKMKLIPKYRVS